MYPLAKVNLEVSGKQIEVEAAVAERLPMGALLGTDVPQLKSLLMHQAAEEDVVVDAMVMTRQGAKIQEREMAEKCHKQEECGVVSHPLLPMNEREEMDETNAREKADETEETDEIEKADETEEREETEEKEKADETEETDEINERESDNWMDRISDELVTPSKKEKKKLTRSQKRKQKAEFGKQDVVAVSRWRNSNNYMSLTLPWRAFGRMYKREVVVDLDSSREMVYCTGYRQEETNEQQILSSLCYLYSVENL